MGSDTVTTEPRKGIFITVSATSLTQPVIVKAFPSNRVYQETNNANIGILKIYDSNRRLISTSPVFSLNNSGIDETLVNLSASYYVVFKGESHLASYLS
ncbi:MAG: hypothetical protein WCJ45_03845 [bacterium]